MIVTTIAFFLLRLAPGDPFSYDDPSISPAIRAQWRATFGYDRPVAEQFARYVGRVARGEFGYSVINRRPVRELIVMMAPRTLSLAFISLALASLVGVFVGVVAAA